VSTGAPDPIQRGERRMRWAMVALGLVLWLAGIAL
jgi:hypothetical protein